MKPMALNDFSCEQNPDSYLHFIHTVMELEGSTRLKLRLIYTALEQFVHSEDEG